MNSTASGRDLASSGMRMKQRAQRPAIGGKRGIAVCLVAMAVLAPQSLPAQEPSPLATTAAMERLVTEAIERAEKSVVAISRVRKEAVGEERPPEGGPPL